MLSGWGSDFMYDASYYKIPKHHFEILKKLKNTWSKSYYANKIFVFDSKDNPDVDLKEFKPLSVTVNFLLNYGEMSQEFIDKYNVKPVHRALMRKSYIENYDEYDTQDDQEQIIWNDGKRFAFGLGYKRPYGNSYVEGDVLEEFLRYEELSEEQVKKIIQYAKDRHQYEEGDEKEPDIFQELVNEYFHDNDVDFLWEIHFEAMEIMLKFLKEETFNIIDFKKVGKWGHSGWEFGKRTMRYRKLNKINESV